MSIPFFGDCCCCFSSWAPLLVDAIIATYKSANQISMDHKNLRCCHQRILTSFWVSSELALLCYKSSAMVQVVSLRRELKKFWSNKVLRIFGMSFIPIGKWDARLQEENGGFNLWNTLRSKILLLNGCLGHSVSQLVYWTIKFHTSPSHKFITVLLHYDTFFSGSSASIKHLN